MGSEEAGKLDPEITTWILEFLIRQPVPDRLINRLLLNDAVSVPDDARLKRAILLRSVDSEVATGSVSEGTLDALETLARMGPATGALRAAYCAVALECAVRFLWGSPARKGKGRYLEAVERIWRARVGRLEERAPGLVGEEVTAWRDEVEAAVWDPAAARRLAERNTRNEAVRLVGEYLEEALEGLGPPFLEVVARELRERKDEEAKEAGGDMGRGGEGERVVVPGEGGVAPIPGAGSVVANGGDGGVVANAEAGDPEVRDVELGIDVAGKEIRKTGRLRVKHVASCRRKRGAAIIVDPEEEEDEEEDADPNRNKYDTLPSAEVNKVKEALKSSCEELRAVVKDPLPDAFRMAETLAAKMGERVGNGVDLKEKCDGDGIRLPNPVGNTSNSEVAGNVLGHDAPVQSQNVEGGGASNPPVGQCAEPRQKQAADAACSYQRDAPKRSLMERNGTAHVYEWEDSIDDSPDTPSKGLARRRLDTPKRQPVSPLKKYEVTKFARRRPLKRWSVEEEDALREGVQKFGKGNWKLILNSRRDVFVERTEVDLKDKWRNLTK